MATSEKQGVVFLWSLFWQEQSQWMLGGPAKPPHVFTWAWFGPALGGAYGSMREAAAGNGPGFVHTYKVSVSGVNVRLLTAVHGYISSILC